MIKLTRQDGNPIYFNPDRICAVYNGGKLTSIDVAEESVYMVTESPEEVAHKITEYKLSTEQHHAYITLQDWESASKVRDIIRKHVGLDEHSKSAI